MPSQNPNVLVLTADALRADRTSLYGYDRPTSPNLESLGAQSIILNNAMTLAPFTQAACVQLFTSSKPLSFGGYDSGAFGRPMTLFERFRQNGYSTWGLSTIHWVSSYYGYTDGLDTEYSVIHINTLVGMAVVNMRDTLYYFRAGKISEEDMLAHVSPIIERMFNNIVNYAEKISPLIPKYRQSFPGSKIANDQYDFLAIKEVVESHRVRFRSDPLAYISQELTNRSRVPEAHEWITRDWYYKRHPKKLVSEALFRASNKILRYFDADIVNRREATIRLIPDAHAIADKVIGALKKSNSDQPFFVWAHFKDTHRPFVSGPGKSWQKHTPRYLGDLGYSPNLDPTLSYQKHYPENDQERHTLSALYDAAIRSTDEAIGRIITALTDMGKIDETVVAFTGDHGEEFGEHGDFGHECMAYEHNSRIPMLFKPAKGDFVPKSDNALVASIDFAPSICALAGIPSMPDWEGFAVTSDIVAQRDHIVLETFCRGNCLFEHRPLYLGIRTKQYKYLWQEGVDPHHKYGQTGPQLFDLRADPGEQNNIYNPNHVLVSIFNEMLVRRLLEIPEVSSERIQALKEPK